MVRFWGYRPVVGGCGGGSVYEKADSGTVSAALGSLLRVQNISRLGLRSPNKLKIASNDRKELFLG